MSLLDSLSHITAMFADLSGIRSCAVCNTELLPDENGICLHCLATLPRTPASFQAVRFADVFANSVAPQGITESWFDYDPTSPWAQMIWQAKYYDSPRLAQDLGYIFGKELQHRLGTLPVDMLLPVPMHWFKRMRRGYNQSLEIAHGISQACGIDVGDNLVAQRPHSTQTHKGNEARRANVKGIIGIEHPSELDGLRIAIVDDIITTGATISECVAEISFSTARPASIGFLTLGSTVKKK